MAIVLGTVAATALIGGGIFAASSASAAPHSTQGGGECVVDAWSKMDFTGTLYPANLKRADFLEVDGNKIKFHYGEYWHTLYVRDSQYVIQRFKACNQAN